jgi:hypothetical protein
MRLACVGGFYLEEPAHKTCEINCKMTLDELCDYILNIFGFDNDHLHRFFVSRSGHDGEEISDEELSLDEVFPLGKGNALFMNFDFGDDWLFRISKQRKKAIYSSDKEYPCIIDEVGVNPEQYPMLEDEEY